MLNLRKMVSAVALKVSLRADSSLLKQVVQESINNEAVVSDMEAAASALYECLSVVEWQIRDTFDSGPVVSVTVEAVEERAALVVEVELNGSYLRLPLEEFLLECEPSSNSSLSRVLM